MFKWIYNIFLGLVGALILLLLLSMFQITDAFKILIVQSGSMEPAIHTGSIVLVMPARDYRANDIITFSDSPNSQTPTTHRIVEIKNDNSQIAFVTKGDANNAADRKEVAPDKVIGKVRLSVPFAGYVIDFVKKPLGFILVIIIPALLVISDEIKKIWQEAKKIKIKHTEKTQADDKENN